MELDEFIKTLGERKKKSEIVAANGEMSPGNEARTVPETIVPTPRSPALGKDIRQPLNTAGREALEQVKQRIHALLVEKLNPEEFKALAGDRQRTEIRRILDAMIDAENYPLSHQQKQAFIGELLNDVLGYGPLERLLRDPSISDILINNANCVYVERNGVLEEVTDVRFRDNAQLLEIIQRIVSRVGRQVNESSPMVDARLLDGSRVNAIVPPLALDGPMMSIRRFGKHPLRIADLLALKAFTPEMCRYMEAAVKARLNILVSGGTGSGKTTLLNALSSFIPANEPHYHH